MYAVTFGSRASFVRRVMAKPRNSISAIDMMIEAAPVAPDRCAYKLDSIVFLLSEAAAQTAAAILIKQMLFYHKISHNARIIYCFVLSLCLIAKNGRETVKKHRQKVFGGVDHWIILHFPKWDRTKSCEEWLCSAPHR